MKDLFKDYCDIARDLLPMYADECTSDAATKALRTHLINCPSCRKYLSNIKKSKENAYKTEIPDVSPDYSDLLRKVKYRKNVKHTVVTAVIIALLIENIALYISKKLKSNA